MNDPIVLYAIFDNGSITPVAFRWKKQKHIIDSIELSYKQREGMYTIFFYSLLSKGVYYKISIHGKDNTVRLHETQTE